MIRKTVYAIVGLVAVAGIAWAANNFPVATFGGTRTVLKSTDNAGVHTIHVNTDTAALPSGAATAANQTSIIGTLAAGTSATNSALTGCVFNSTVPTLTAGQQVAAQCDSTGSQFVNTEGRKASYGLGFTVAPAASATDVAVLTGSGTKTVRVNRVAVTGIATTAVTTPVQLVKRTTANTGGTSADQSGNIGKHDSGSGAATATAASYTANPTTGTASGNIRRQYMHFPLATAPGSQIVWTFGDRNDQALVLRGTAEQLAVNLQAVTVSGGSLIVEFDWTEE